MKKRSRKLISILLTLSMLVVLLVPMVGPAAAKSVNNVSRTISVSDDYEGYVTDFTVKEDSEFVNDFQTGDVLELKLKSGVKWLRNGTAYAGVGGIRVNNTVINATYVRASDTSLTITMPTMNPNNVDSIDIPLYVDIDGSDGSIYFTIVDNNNGFTSNQYEFAIVKTGDTVASVESVEKIGKSGDTGGQIRIDESSRGSLGSVTNGNLVGNKQTLKLKLSSNFEWQNLNADHFYFGGGFDEPNDLLISGNNDQTATITFTPKYLSGTSAFGTIYIDTPIRATNSANYGDVEVSISGSPDIDDADLLVAEYVDWGVDVSIKSVKDLSAGKVEDITTDTIKIEESVANTLINGRDITITLPDWVKITGISNTSSTGALSSTNISSASLVGVGNTIDGTANDFDITIKSTGTSSSTGKLEFKLDLSIEADKTGDVEAIISGSGIGETTLVVAKAYAPVSATVDKVNDVKMGVQSQEVADIYITEEIKEAAKATDANNKQGYIKLTAPDGVKFSSTPTAEVVEGNLTLKSDAKLTDNDKVFQIPVDSDSTKPSTLKISNIKVTVDRTYPEGDIQFKVGGNALVENYEGAFDGYLGGSYGTYNGNTIASDAGVFTTASVVKLKVATCTTPAPGETKYESVFKIGETTYTQNGVSRTMDVAPYLSNGRTYMPIRYAAYAAGVSESNIMWADEDQSVTLVKGDRVVRLSIGDTTMLINGVPFTMDVAPELVNPGRTMLPVRWVAQALGCAVDWKEATQEVTVSTQ